MKRAAVFVLALVMAAPAAAQAPVGRVAVQPQPQQLPPECRERDVNPEKCVIKDGPPPPPRARKKKPPPPPSAEPKPPAKQEPTPPKVAPRP
jgi:hypothetical protein